jgi:putative nucleotidyltransferase with HDIG domain
VNGRLPALDPVRPSAPSLIERLLVAGSLALVSWVTLRLVVNQQAFLDVYFLPVAWASWRLGRRAGALIAISSAAIVFASAWMDHELFSHPDLPDWMRWTDLGLWAGFLFLTSAAVSVLAGRERRHVEQVRAVYIGVLEIMAKFIDSIDRSTDNHSRRVAERCIEVARHLGVPEADIETLRVGAYLHDIGKVEVSADVLRKAAALTDAERAEMERHVEYGSAMISRLGGLLEGVVPLVLYHHERWDGRGYKSLRGESIPLGARILAVCDTYDAIVADRPYHKGAPHQHAIEILRAETGLQFDPTVVDAFLELYDEGAPDDLDSGAAEEQVA